jgi:hypothetical protein
MSIYISKTKKDYFLESIAPQNEVRCYEGRVPPPPVRGKPKEEVSNGAAYEKHGLHGIVGWHVII